MKMDFGKIGKEEISKSAGYASWPAIRTPVRILYGERWRDLVYSLYDRHHRISVRLLKKIERLGRRQSAREERGRSACRGEGQPS